jgi:hypoxanthine phosphoribosyltransferase
VRGPSSRSKAEAQTPLEAALAVRRTARRLHSARDVARGLDRMADELTPRLEHTAPVVLAVMQGGMFAAVELARRLAFPHELDYVHLTRYRGDLRGTDVEWRVRPRPELAGRTVLVVDDILDHGTTLRELAAELTRVGVAEQLHAVLVVKNLADARARPHVDVVGITVDDVYVFGSGMDYRGYWRTLPGIYAATAEPLP